MNINKPIKMRAPDSKSDTGQILILLALGIVVLLAFVALALDGGVILLDRRRAQNAADASALAGAYVLARNPDDGSLAADIMTASGAMAHSNNYGTLDGKTFTVYYPPAAASIRMVAGDADMSHYVRVTITSTVETSFLHFVFPGPVQTTVESVAHVLPSQWGPLFNGSGLVSLDPSDSKALTIQGDVNANLIGGGIFVNSTDTNAAWGPGGAKQVYTPSMNVVGGVQGALASEIIVSPGILTTGYSPAIPFDNRLALSLPGCSTNATKKTGVIISGVTYDYEFSPDAATGTGKISVNDFTKDNSSIFFDPGIYCINIGNGANISSSQSLYGRGVLFHITGVRPCNLGIAGGATFQLSGYKGGTDFDGLLFYFDGDYSSAPQSSLILNGTSSSYMKGTVYAPTCAVTLNGTDGNTYQGQLIGYDITLTGAAALNLQFVASDNFEERTPSKVDLNQ